MAQKESRHSFGRRTLLSATLVSLAFLGRAEADRAQGSIPGPSRARFVLSQSYAWDTIGPFGGARDRGRGALTLQFGWRRTLIETPGFLLEYALEVVPLELAFGDRVSEAAGAAAETVFGAGIDPLGVEARFGRGWLRPYVALRTGFRIFTLPVPTARGTRFNFVLGVGAGLELRIREGRWAFVGVELHHLSNGGLGEANPSLNLLALHGGLALRR